MLDVIMFVAFIAVAGLLFGIHEEAVKTALREQYEETFGELDEGEELWYSVDGISWFKL